MPNSASVQQLVGQVRTRIDVQNAPLFSDQFELIPWVRDSHKQLYEIITQRWLDWYTIRRPMSLAAGTDSYSLPPDFRAMKAVYMVYTNTGGVANNGYREELRQFGRAEWGRYNYTATNRQWPFAYYIQNNRMLMTPVSVQDYVNAMELQYVPQYKGPVLDWTPIDPILPNGWEEWIVLDVMLKMGSKARFNVAQVQQDKMEIEKRVITGASSRSADPPQMRDVNAIPSYNWWAGTPGGPATWAL